MALCLVAGSGLRGAQNAGSGFLPLWGNGRGHVCDLVLIYQGGVKRLEWTGEELAPYVTWKKGGKEEWLFDGFLFIEFSDGKGREYAAGYTRNPAGKEEWEWLLERNFSGSNALPALEKEVGAAVERIGQPAIRRKVVLTLPEPIYGQTNWGSIGGRALDFRKAEDRIAACEWHVEQALEHWKRLNPQHLELAGFYWVAEQDTRAREILPRIGERIRQRAGMRFYWIPYWNASGAGQWRELGFDYAWQQPNHFFHPDKVPDSRLGEATAYARGRGLGLEFEADARALSQPEVFRPRFYRYLEAFEREGVKTNGSVAYYEGGGALLSMANSAEAEVRRLYDTLAEWVSARQKVAAAAAMAGGSSASAGAGSSAAGGSPADFEPLPEVPAPRVYRDRVRAQWFDGGRKFWYRVNVGGDRHEFVVVDAERGTRGSAFDHGAMAKALGEGGVAGVRGERLALENVVFDAEGTGVEFGAGGKRWRWQMAEGRLTERERGERGAGGGSELATASRRSRRTGGETSLSFYNRSGDAVELFWLDTEGERRSYGQLKPGESRDQHTFGGHVWLVLGAGGKELAVLEAQDDASSFEITGEVVVRRAPEARVGRGRVRGGEESPDGAWRVVIREHNVVLRDTGSGEETALTRDGTEADGYGGAVYWAPDAKKFVVMRTEKGETRTVSLVESAPADQLQPKLIQFDYLKPGDRIARARPCLFEVASRCQITVSNALFATPWSISELRWSTNSDRFTFLYNQRGHQVLRVVAVDGQTGAARAIIDEQSATFIDYAGKQFLRHVEGTEEVIWMSERDGWNHLYLYDGRSGELKNAITRGEWVVRGVDHVDTAGRQIWFRAGGIRPGQDPYYVHHARVNFDGTGLVVLTEGDGTHEVQFSPDRRFLVDTWSRVDQPPVTELRRAVDGGLVCRLEEAVVDDGAAPGWRAPQRFVAKGRDGQTDIYGILHFPRNFDASRRYPVIESIYAGPQGAFVPKSFRGSYGQERLAGEGFVVVQIDGMGTSHRSKKFHDVCWKNLGDSGFPDRILWMRAAAEVYPFMDLSRVGVYGTSAGGQSALRALLAFGDFYKAGVADSGCHDNRMDKIWWNELWMGWPLGAHYEEQSNVTQAHRLKGRLLLVAGELDRNVDPASTVQVANALVKAKKRFEYLMFPGAGHGVLGSPYGQVLMRDFFVRALR